jgi:hypothetical protein
MRAIVQFGRLATGSSSNGATTRKAVLLFTSDGPGATLAFNASVPPRLKSLHHSRTVSSRTPNASAIRGLVQPESVSKKGTGSVRLAAIARPGQGRQGSALVIAR